MMHSHFVPYYNEHICDKTKPYPGIYEMLDRLSEKGISFAVASNKYQEGTEMLIERLFGDYEFISILGQRVGKPIKPDPQIVKEAMEAFGEISNSEVVYCGDSDVDMLTGMNAGVKTIGVTWGFRTREELSSYSPWILADKAEDISDAILKD
jgi:phosphoglycolate phosphatase